MQYSVAVFSLVLFVTLGINAQESYKKTYYDNGNLKSEGWISNNKKIKYWTFYYPNGRVKKRRPFSAR